MVVRILALLLAVLMMTGAAAQVHASPDVTSELGDAPEDLDTPIVPAVVVVPRPGLRTPVSIEAPRSLGRGRLLAVFVFRPPRLVASR